MVPVLLSPAVLRSELVFEYEKPTPAGDSRKRIFASVPINKLKKKKTLCLKKIRCHSEKKRF